MDSTIKIIDKLSNQTLYQFSMENIEKAYQKAAQLEEMGIDFVISIPSTAQTLLQSLGADQFTINYLKEEIDNEIDSHNEDSCCFKKEE